MSPPGGLEMVVFWTKKAARTADLIQSVTAYGKADPKAYGVLMDDLRSTASRFADAFGSNDERGVISAADAYGQTLVGLGKAAKVPIVTPAHAAAARLARELGGAAKSSGAGGGDVGVAFFSDAEAAAAFTSRCPEGLLVLDIRLGAAGAHRRVPGRIETFKKD